MFRKKKSTINGVELPDDFEEKDVKQYARHLDSFLVGIDFE